MLDEYSLRYAMMKTESVKIRLLMLPIRLLDALLIGTFKLTYLLIFWRPHKDPPKVIHPKGNYYGPSRQEKNLIDKLNSWNIKCIPQYRDKRWKRRFSIDVYVPKYKVGIEVNGTFKYKKGEINPYYKKRADIIFETSGIVIIDIIHTQVKPLTKKEVLKLLKDNSPS